MQYSLYIQLCAFISQYSNKIDFISLGKAEMGAKGEQSQTRGQGPLACP